MRLIVYFGIITLAYLKTEWAQADLNENIDIHGSTKLDKNTTQNLFPKRQPELVFDITSVHPSNDEISTPSVILLKNKELKHKKKKHKKSKRKKKGRKRKGKKRKKHSSKRKQNRKEKKRRNRNKKIHNLYNNFINETLKLNTSFVSQINDAEPIKGVSSSQIPGDFARSKRLTRYRGRRPGRFRHNHIRSSSALLNRHRNWVRRMQLRHDLLSSSFRNGIQKRINNAKRKWLVANNIPREKLYKSFFIPDKFSNDKPVQKRPTFKHLWNSDSNTKQNKKPPLKNWNNNGGASDVSRKKVVFTKITPWHKGNDETLKPDSKHHSRPLTPTTLEGELEREPLIPNHNNVHKRKTHHSRNNKRDETEWEWLASGRGTNDRKPTVDTDINKVDDETTNEIDPFDVTRCLECPPKKKVQAERGHDYAPLIIPTPKDICHTRKKMQFHVEVIPKPGSMLHEGHYFFNVSFLGGPQGKTPLKTCTYDYEVKVKKCASLPSVSGGSVICDTGHAWGSKCMWRCQPGKKLVGAPSATCIGHKRAPFWSQKKLPVCVDTGCEIPQHLKGVSLSCTLPIPQETLVEKLRTMQLYPEGSKCQVQCKFADKTSDRHTLSQCLSTGKWFPDMSTCCNKKRTLPRALDGECQDFGIELVGPGVVRLNTPRFVTADGKAAFVWCDKNTVNRPGTQCRTCKAHDEELGSRTSCYQCIHVSTKAECPAIEAPHNGKLECRTRASGDTECLVTCNRGFNLASAISSGKVMCSKGSLMWNYQTYRNHRLPSCVLR